MTEPIENPDDPAHLARLEAETEAAARAENDALLLGMSPWLMIGGCLVLAVMSPLLMIWLGALPFGTTNGVTGWLWVSFPLLVYAGLVFRRARFKMPNGQVYQGWKVRAAAVLAVLVSLAIFLLRWFAP
ncbi:hypothetical protein HZY97_19040 [Sphingomonas sp. R-74633]|uniref:hypothetical protein n=1 Tax=Sphingomonas sp. R-74633 TaxID=2751188 RepID=UPI0015D36B34|nr:hypothetical protein [Sphingomonas sp. R-74633]NYT42877.1 hypothetical protein [Sphingomonas sp. R-74633]